MKKTICFILSVLIFISILCSLLFYRKHDLKESISPDGSHKIVVKYMNIHAWPFGPHDILISHRDRNGLFSHNIIKTKLYNDGKIPDKENCIITWENSIANITLKGEEQDNEVYKIDFLTMKIERLK